jgi:hypothetical protein
VSDRSVQDRAFDATQKYKEGHFILEKNLLCDAESLATDVGQSLAALRRSHADSAPDDLDCSLEVYIGRDAMDKPMSITGL